MIPSVARAECCFGAFPTAFSLVPESVSCFIIRKPDHHRDGPAVFIEEGENLEQS